jgi:hypothetical protein
MKPGALGQVAAHITKAALTKEGHVMSWHAVEHVLQSSKATGSDRLVLLVIAHHINDKTGLTWLSEQTLVGETRLSLRQVKYSLKSLETHKELLIRHTVGRGHAQTFALPGNSAEAALFQPNGADHGRKRCKSRQEMVQIMTGNGAEAAPLYNVFQDVEREVSSVLTHEEAKRPQDVDPAYMTDVKALLQAGGFGRTSPERSAEVQP